MKLFTRHYLILFILTIACSVTGLRSFSQGWDLRLAEHINPQNPHAFVWRAATSSAYPLGAALPIGQFVYGVLAKDSKSRYNAYESLGGLAFSAIVAEALKYGVDRQRPAEKHPGEIFPQSNEHGHSFPSGHATVAFATATTLALEYKKWYITVPAYLWAAGVGYSRVYMGEHYPTDVIGGAVIGAGGALLSHWLTRRIFRY